MTKEGQLDKLLGGARGTSKKSILDASKIARVKLSNTELDYIIDLCLKYRLNPHRLHRHITLTRTNAMRLCVIVLAAGWVEIAKILGVTAQCFDTDMKNKTVTCTVVTVEGRLASVTEKSSDYPYPANIIFKRSWDRTLRFRSYAQALRLLGATGVIDEWEALDYKHSEMGGDEDIEPEEVTQGILEEYAP